VPGGGIEPGTAVQQSGALSTKPRRTLQKILPLTYLNLFKFDLSSQILMLLVYVADVISA
jgi:hypothetical protein